MTVNALIHYFTKWGLAYLLPLCNSCSAGKQNTFGMIPFSCSLWVMNFSLLCESLMCVGCRRNLGSPCIPPGLGNSNPVSLPCELMVWGLQQITWTTPTSQKGLEIPIHQGLEQPGLILQTRVQPLHLCLTFPKPPKLSAHSIRQLTAQGVVSQQERLPGLPKGPRKTCQGEFSSLQAAEPPLC